MNASESSKDLEEGRGEERRGEVEGVNVDAEIKVNANAKKVNVNIKAE